MEIAIGILRADPKEDVTPARGWALDVIEKNSGVPFSKEDREALLHKPLSAENPVAWAPPQGTGLPLLDEMMGVSRNRKQTPAEKK